MRISRRFFLILSVLLIQTNVFSTGSKRMTFTQISSEDGLSQNTVMSIVQDKNDFLWFATSDGLNRYDGYNFTVYRNEKENEHSLQNDVLRTLYIDSENNLWVGCKSGLSRYVAERNQFENYVCTVCSGGQSPQINAIIEFDKNNLLLGTEYGLVLFNKTTRKFEKFPAVTNGLVSIQSLARQNKNILVGTNKGLYLYNITKKYYTTVHQALDGKIIQAILPQSEWRVWVGTEGNGLYLVNLQTGELKNYLNNPSDPKSLSSNYIRSLAFDSEYRLWIGTFHALSVKENGSETFENYYHNPQEKGSIGQNSIRSIYMDTQGGMWLGTYYAGLNYYHPLKNQFGHIQQNPYTRSLNDKVISCIMEDETGKIWIGTNDKGIDVYNPKTGQFNYFTQASGSLASNNIKALLSMRNQQSIYVGAHGGGLMMMNKSTGKCSRIPATPNLANENVYALTYDLQGNLWIGTLTGLFCYNEAKREIKKIDISRLPSDQVLFLKADSKKRLWIGGEKSLAVYSLANGQMRDFTSGQYNGTFSNGSINCIFEDSKKRIWIGTRGGLNLYNENGTFKSYSTQEGLPNNMVYGILEDSFGRLWVSTNNGLSCFSPETKKFRNYSKADGLPFRQFNPYSFCQSKSGLMYFGGVNGIVTFYPELLIDNPYTPKAHIARIQIFNKDVNPFDETGVLKNSLSETKKIELQPAQSSFTLEIGVTNYLSGMHNTFAYMLEGLDKNWNYTSDNRFISYSNLKHGKYKFKVKAANSDGKWNEETTELTIVVLPYWWQSWWASLLLWLLIGSAAYAYIRFRHQRLEMSNQLQLERLEKEKMEEVNQMKMRFFINISHEFRTPLTLILSPLEEIIERTSDKWQRSQLIHVKKNANKMLHLVNQLMDYRRAELGVFELSAQRQIPEKTISETYALFDKLAKRKKINYKLEDHTNGKEFLIDINYLELILSNLLSNAFKFTPDNGKICVRTIEDVNYFILEVEDTGCGIPADKQTLIFDRFYQIGTENLGTGIGLSLVKRLIDLHHGYIEVKSEEGKGSIFSVNFPQNSEVYNALELGNNTPDATHTTNTRDIDFIIQEQKGNEPETGEQEKSETVLVVEDNADVLEYLKERLSQNYITLTANNGAEALECLKNNQVDLVLTDVMMPVMDGIKLCKTIKQNIRTCHIPVIILSAKSNTEDQLEGLDVGADDYVPKPFTYSVLSAKIQNMLRSRRRILEHYSNSLEVEPEKITFNAMDEELLTKAMKVVMNNLDNSDFSTDQFCAAMAMSRSNLHLKLKAITGESTIDFIRKIRFNEASKLLLDGRYNITEVSTMVGFNTPSYFATSFKKYFGCLPTEYVKKHRM